jgi:LacI family transcriptional regulator
MAYMGVQFLVKHGRRKIAIIYTTPTSGDSPVHGYRLAIEEGGLEFNPKLEQVICVDDIKGVIKLLRAFPDIDGLYLADDYLCPSVTAALNALGRQDPKDVEVVTFSNKGNELNNSISFARVEIDPFEIGHKAAELLIKLLSGDIPSGFSYTCSPKLITNTVKVKE